jgi:hypothetical protein
MNKILLISISILVGMIAILGYKINSASSSTGGGITISTSPNPLTIGPATFIITVKDKAGKLVNDATVSFDINMTTMNMGIQKGVAKSEGNGKYNAVGNMSMRGPWRISIIAKMADGSIQNEDFVINVK